MFDLLTVKRHASTQIFDLNFCIDGRVCMQLVT